MKKNIIYFIALFILATSCDDVLDKHNRNVLGEDIWDVETQAEAEVNKLYEQNMPGMSLAENSGFTDEIFSSSETYTNFLYGFLGDGIASSKTYISIDDYAELRNINLVIKGLKTSSLAADVKNNLLGQAYFFRAWKHWELVKIHGGIPLIMSLLDPFFDELDIPRSSTSLCIDAIINDLDMAIDDIALNTDDGRITRGAAAAFKGRVLLAWASPMFNPDNKAERWTLAYNANTAAKALLDSAGYGLNSNFSTIFTKDPTLNKEAILYHSFNGTIDYSNDWESKVRPVSGGGSGNNAPTWELVKAFPMANGKLITDPSSGYDSVYYWQNRDPRFYATIGYNGCTWDMTGSTGLTNKVWTFYLTITENRRSPASGFYCRKASDSSVDYNMVSQCNTAWLEIRYAEVLMNLAECANEVGNGAEAISLMGEIRDRAGIDAADNYGLGSSTDVVSIREMVMRERQIEFAFENKRYWDIRRRKMFTQAVGPNMPKLNGTKRHGLSIKPKGAWGTKRITSGDYRAWRIIDTAAYLGHIDIDRPGDYETYFTVELKELDALDAYGNDAKFNYKDYYYFLYIPKGFLEHCPAVEQTIGWVNGTFDPLAE